MAKKDKPANKAVTSKPANKSIDWSTIAARVTIVATGGRHMEKGEVHEVTKEMAKILIESGQAKLK